MILPVRWRLALASGLGVAVGGTILALIVVSILRSELDRSATQAVLVDAVRIADSVDEGLKIDVRLGSERLIFAALLDKNGVSVDSEGRAPDDLTEYSPVRAALQGQSSVAFEPGGRPIIVAAGRADADDIRAGHPPVAVLIVSSRGANEATTRLTRILAAAIPIAALFAAAGGAILGRRALSPVEAMTRRAGEIGDEDLAMRIDVPMTGDEVAQHGHALNLMLDRIEEAVRKNARFVADASHELRNPLTNLSTEIQTLLRRERTVEEYAASIGSLDEEVRRLTRIADGLLFLAKQSDPAVEGSSEHDLSKAVSDVVARLDHEAKAAGVEITLTADPGVMVSAAQEILRRIISNLIENSIRYTPRGGGVDVRIKAMDGAATMTVTDTGIGIASEDRGNIFEPFWRGTRARDISPQGAGLGLAIVREALETSGGKIEIDTPPSGGTRVTVKFCKKDQGLHEDLISGD